MKVLGLFALALLWAAEADFTYSSQSHVITQIRVASVDNRTLEVRAARVDIHGGRVLDLFFSTFPVPRFIVRVLNYDVLSPELAAALYLASRWSLWKVIEYNSSAGYANTPFDPDDGHHSIVSEHFLWENVSDPAEPRKWSPLHYARFNVSTVNGTAEVHEAYSFWTNTRNGLIVKLSAFYTNRALEFDDAKSVIRPNGIKWGLEIYNYPYTRNNTNLALKVGFDTQADILDPPANLSSTDRSPADTDTAVDYLDLGNQSYHVWARQVELNGTGCSASSSVNRTVVKKTESANDTDWNFPLKTNDPDVLLITKATRIVYWSVLPVPFCQPNLVSWDPELISDQDLSATGASSSSSSSSSIGSSGVSTGSSGVSTGSTSTGSTSTGSAGSTGSSGSTTVVPSFLMIGALVFVSLKVQGTKD
jgi:hypothetical protein